MTMISNMMVMICPPHHALKSSPLWSYDDDFENGVGRGDDGNEYCTQKAEN